MSGRSPANSLKPLRCHAHRVPAVPVVAAVLILWAATGGAQAGAVGQGPDRRGFTQDANGPQAPGPPFELAVLSRMRPPGPAMEQSVPPAMRYQLRVAYETALRALRREAGCRALFQRLGANGEAMLARSVYSCAGENRRCEERVAAFTTVGSTRIRLCHGFQALPIPSAAVLLLHEALHSAGLLESPPHANAMTAHEISTLVSQGCSLN